MGKIVDKKTKKQITHFSKIEEGKAKKKERNYHT